MYRLLAFFFIALIGVTGCQQQEPEPVEPEAPPPPTCEEVFQELRGALQPLFAAVDQGVAINDAVRENMVAGFGSLRSRHSATENGPCGLDRMANEMTRLIRDAKEENRWNAIKGACQIYAIIRPNDGRHAEDEKKADLILGRPTVKSNGFFESDGYLYAFLEVTDKDTGRIKTYRVREGEEFHDVLRLERIVGNQEAVEIWYEPLGETWEVSAPRGRNTTRGGRVSGR